MMHCYVALGLRISNSPQAVIYAFTRYCLKQEELHLSRYPHFVRRVSPCPGESILRNIKVCLCYLCTERRHVKTSYVEDISHFATFSNARHQAISSHGTD